jgi:hypothetical protein
MSSNKQFIKETFNGHRQNSTGHLSSSGCSIHAGWNNSALLGQHRLDPAWWFTGDGARLVACNYQEVTIYPKENSQKTLYQQKRLLVVKGGDPQTKNCLVDF